MAQLEGNIKRFIGDSAEVRPTPFPSGTMAEGETIPPGSSWFSRDTFEIERWDGTRWSRAPQDTEVVAMLGMILDVQRSNNELLQLMLDKL